MFDLLTYTIIHTVISLLALVAGVALLFGFAAGQPKPGLANTTLALLFLTTATGFGFPFEKFLPSHLFGILSVIAMAVIIWSRWSRGLENGAKAYVISLAFAIYLDAFVTVVQAFLKIPFLNALAPTQESPVFLVSQAILLVAFVLLGRAAVRGLPRVRSTAVSRPLQGRTS